MQIEIMILLLFYMKIVYIHVLNYIIVVKLTVRRTMSRKGQGISLTFRATRA